jgi:membrane dipeptidase
LRRARLALSGGFAIILVSTRGDGLAGRQVTGPPVAAEAGSSRLPCRTGSQPMLVIPTRRFAAIALLLGYTGALPCLASTPTTGPGKPTEAHGAQPPAVPSPEALRIHRSGILIDGHNDLPWRIRRLGDSSFDKLDIARPQPRLHTDIPRLRTGGVDAQFWVVYVPPETLRTRTATKMALEQFDLIHRMAKRYSDVFEMAYTADDIERIARKGKIASLIGIEGGHMIENALPTLADFYQRGARYMGLTHTETIDWADSATDDPQHGGLTTFGEQVVLEMNRLGMLVDLAHVSADTMRDALRVSRAPVIASHSSAYAVAAHVRNVPDDVLAMIQHNGGVVMINFFPGYSHPVGARQMSGYFEKERALKAQFPDTAVYKRKWAEWKAAHPIPAGTVHDLVDHVDHIVQVAGIDHVGLGSDFDGVGIMPVGLEDVSGYPNLTQALLERGYDEQAIHKIMGGNLLRALRQAERIARTWPSP